MARKLVKTWLLLLIVPIGLRDGASDVANRADRPARRIGADFVGFWIGMFVNLAGLQIKKSFIAKILQHQGLLAVAYNDPIPVPDFQAGHGGPPCGLSRILSPWER